MAILTHTLIENSLLDKINVYFGFQKDLRRMLENIVISTKIFVVAYRCFTVTEIEHKD